jgi:hypothetical protein
MAKRKITVTVDEELVDQLQAAGENVSAVVNDALATHFEALARRAALGSLLDQLDAELGPPSEAAMERARAAFAELDGDLEAEPDVSPAA